MKKINVILFVLLLTALSLGMFSIHLSNKVSSDSVYASKLNTENEVLDEQNTTLKADILKYTTLEAIQARADQLGFVEGKQIISLYSPLEVAKK